MPASTDRQRPQPLPTEDDAEDAIAEDAQAAWPRCTTVRHRMVAVLTCLIGLAIGLALGLAVGLAIHDGRQGERQVSRTNFEGANAAEATQLMAAATTQIEGRPDDHWSNQGVQGWGGKGKGKGKGWGTDHGKGKGQLGADRVGKGKGQGAEPLYGSATLRHEDEESGSCVSSIGVELSASTAAAFALAKLNTCIVNRVLAFHNSARLAATWVRSSSLAL